MAKIVINWTGFTGAPGYTNLYFRDFDTGEMDQTTVDGAVSKVDTWIGFVLSRLPNTVTLRVNPVIEIVEETTGALTRFMNATTLAARTGVGTGNYSASSGACVNWYTNVVRNGRRIRGRTFLVPFAGNSLGPDGTLDNTGLTNLTTNTAALIAAAGDGDLGVWARPTAPGASDGVWAVVTSFTIPDKAAVLRSRRD